MTGRKSKLTPALQKQIVKLLEQGNSVEDVCSQIDITDRSYYNWRERGEAAARLLDEDSAADLPEDEVPYFQFFQATTRAQNNAKVKAVGALYHAIDGYKTVEKTIAVFRETRYHKPAKEGDEPKPYIYEETKTTTKTIQHAPDAHAAIEYLKRRFPDEWSDRLRIDLDPALIKELQALAAAQQVDLKDLLRALAEELKSSDG
jgi:transposase-like protein